uniref:USP domain-containing protein n=1 Tax=Panagrellus redivivus TaxID=6233 RepID=A0A7E4V7V7_PANRE
DYSSGFRVKLNDVVTFPDYLDLNSLFVPAAPDNGRDVDGWLNKPPTCPEVQAMLANGKDVYELFAIMIHQGSATGGHYFAYIKNLEQSQWLCFNDTQVMPVDSEEVKQGFASAGENNKNVCQMMYCRIDPERNEAFTRNADLPEHVMNWLKQWDEEESRQAKELIRLDSLVNVHCLLNDERSLVDTSPHGSVDRVFNRKDTAATVVKQFCPYYLECGIHITPETAVLFKSNSSYNFTDMTPVDPQTTIDHLLKKSYHTASELNFILEVNSEAYNLPAPPVLGDFGILTETLRTLDFLTVDITHNLVRSCKRICSTDVEMVYHLRHRIKALFPQTGVDGIPCRIVLDNMIDDGSPMKLIDDDSQTVGELLKYKFHNMRFYIDCGDPERLKADRLVENFIDSQMCRIIEKKKFGIHVMIQLPSDADYRQAGLRPPSANGVGANVVRSVVDDDSEYAVHVGESGYSYIRNCRYVNVIVDHLQYTKKLIEWIGRYLDISSDKIGLAKHYSDTDVKGYDMTLYATETVKSSFASVSRVTVTLKVPCKPGEKLVRVVEFDLNNESCPDNWPTLFSIPVTDDTPFSDFKAQCLATLDSAYAEKLEPNSVRLREIANVGAPVLSLNKTFKARRNIALDSIIALQRVKPGVDVYVVKEDAPEMASIIVRRFCPSTLETMPPFEILLPVSLTENGTQLVKKIIADHAKLVPERIAISEFQPMGTFARWPFTRSTLDMCEHVKFMETVPFPTDYNGKSVYFIDRNETKKVLTEDDRRSLKIRERMNNTSTNTARRTERPLRIQMSSISEDT